MAALDAISDGRPVILISGDAHNGWLNSAALALFGLAPRADVLTENEWYAVWSRLGEIPREPGAEDAVVRDAATRAAALGVVGVTDLEMARTWEIWPRRIERGIDQLRVRAATYAATLDDVIGTGLRTGDALPGGRELATMGPFKVITDGSLNTRTAYCHTTYGGGRGILNVAPHELTELMRRAHESGLEVAAHAIGDAALASALDAFAATRARGAIEHFFLGSSAEKIVARSRVPVLTVRGG